MAINFLDEVYTQLEQLDLVSSRREFCEQWLGRAEGYVRTLRFYQCQPSVGVKNDKQPQHSFAFHTGL